MSQPESPKPVNPIVKGTEILEKHAQHSYSGFAMRMKHANETVGMKKPSRKQVAVSPVTKLKHMFSNMTFVETTSQASQPLRPKSSTANSGGSGTKTYTIISCSKCGWSSKPMTVKEVNDLGVPWYCDSCGERVTHWKSGTLDELTK